MDADATIHARARAPRPRGGKPRAGGTAATRPKHLRLSALALERLAVEAAMGRETESAIVERLILAGLRRWVVHDRGDRAVESPAA